jgi:hypothetical protein
VAEPVPVLSGTVAPANQADLTWNDPGTTSKILFTASGVYSKSLVMISAAVTAIAAGAGGQSGGAPVAGFFGGDAGGAGGVSEGTFTPGELTSTVTVTVGAGGPGGAGTSAGANQFSAMNNGTNGGGTSFGAYLTASGGVARNGATTPIGGAGSTQQGGGWQTTPPGSAGKGANGSVYPGTIGNVGGAATLAPGGGGGGGLQGVIGFDFHVLPTVGGAGQTSLVPSAGGAINSNGANADMVTGYAGGGGGGGDAPSAGTGLNGGNGGLYGAGGGGGSCGFSQSTSYTNGAGGNGAGGVVAVIETYPPPASYNVYRDDVLVANVTGLTYADVPGLPGTYEYTVTAVYSGVESVSSNTVTLTLTVPAGQRMGTSYSTAQLIAQFQTAEDPTNPLLEE